MGAWLAKFPLAFGQIDANALFVVANIHASIRECWCAPNDFSSKGEIRWFNDRGSVQFLKSLRIDLGDHQFTLLVEEIEPVLVFNEEGGSRAFGAWAKNFAAFP